MCGYFCKPDVRDLKDGQLAVKTTAKRAAADR